jgi:hypothetical protein
MNVPANTYQKHGISFLVIILLFLAGIPLHDFRFSSGLDSPLCWTFNYLFKNNIFHFPVTAFPYGPLAFLMFPLPPNFIPYLIFHAFIVVALWYGILLHHESFTGVEHFKQNILRTAIFCFISLFILAIQFQFILIVIIGLWLYHKKYYPNFGLFISLLSASVLWYVKITGGVLSAAIWGSYIIWGFYKERKIKNLQPLILYGFITYITGLIIYGSFLNPIKFIYYSLLISSGNQDIALYVNNSLLYMSLVILLLILLYFQSRMKEKHIFFSMLLIPLFISIKHGFGREDSSHLHDLILFILVLLISEHIFSYHISIGKFTTAILLTGIIHMHVSDVAYTENFGLFPFRLQFLFDYPYLKKSSAYYNRLETERLIPDTLTLKKLKGKQADVFPWDQTLLLAHKMTWLPRPSVLVNSVPICDKMNEYHLKAPWAPEYLLWKKHALFNGCSYGSIDERYSFHEEPKFMKAWITHYSLDTCTDYFNVWKKKQTPDTLKILKEKEGRFIPEQIIFFPDSFKNHFVFMKLEYKKSIAERIISVLYKPDPVWIKIFTREQITLTFRLSEYSAKEGIWMYPLLYTGQTILHPTAFKIFGTEKEGKYKIEMYDYFMHSGEKVFSENVLCINPEKIKVMKKYTISFKQDSLFDFNSEYHKENLLSVNVLNYGFRFKSDTIQRGASFLRTEIPVYYHHLHKPKEIKFCLYEIINNQIWRQIFEIPIIHFMKKGVKPTYLEMNFPAYMFDDKKEYGIYIHVLSDDKISIGEGKLLILQNTKYQ